jgi:hypothetical protein
MSATMTHDAIEHDRAIKNAMKLGAIEPPNQPGGFVGDIWFGHPEKRAMGTHRWDGKEWHVLPTEMDAVLSLLAEARAEIVTLKAASVPDGMAILPRDPTSEMLDAAFFAMIRDNFCDLHHLLDNCYRAMLAAAPTRRDAP